MLPARSIVRAPAGAFTLDAGPTSVIRPFWMTMVWLGFGAAPVPSMRVTFVSATTGSCHARRTAAHLLRRARRGLGGERCDRADERVGQHERTELLKGP